MTISPFASLRRAAALAALVPAAACGGDLTVPDGGDDLPLPTLSLTAQAGDGQDGIVGEPLPGRLAVRVTAGGEPQASRAVVFEPVSGDGTLAPDTTLTDADGRASSAWTLGGAPGEQQAVARLVGGDDEVYFTARAAVGSPSRLTPVSGDDQSGDPFQPLPQPLVVRVTDRFGNPVEGVVVRWQVRNGGGGVSPEEAATDAGGYAQTSWTPGFSFGRQRVWAVVDGLDGSPVEFEADIF